MSLIGANGETLHSKGNTVLLQIQNTKKEVIKIIGIYQLTNKVNGKRYIGQSKNIKRRMWEHKCLSSMQGSPLKEDIKLFGFDSFELTVLEECPPDDLDSKEQMYIAKIKPEYNRCKGGRGCPGRVVTDEQRKVLHDAGVSSWELKTDAEKEHVIKYQLKGPEIGHKVSMDTRQKLREANIGKKQSEDTIRKRSAKMHASMIGNRNGNKAVKIIETGKIFESVKLAGTVIGISPGCITKALKGKQKTAGGYHWEYLQ